MKSRLRAEFGLRTMPLAIAALPAFFTELAAAQQAPAAAPPAAVATPPTAAAAPTPAVEPANPPPAAGSVAPATTDGNAPTPGMAAGGTNVPTVPTTVAVAPVTAPEPPTVPPVAPNEEETYKKINMGFWLRIAGVAQNPVQRNRINRLSSNGEVEAHFSNRMRKWLQWTANFVGTYGGGSVDGAGQFALLDLIAQLEPHESFNFWAGRMLVPSDRANFAGPYFMAPWVYPGAFGAGPRQGPFGRNDGATIWGQFGGGIFKYYAGVYNLYGDQRTNGQFTAPLFSGRLNLSLLNPEPGFYHNATYYGQNILAIGLGGQYQKNGTATTAAAGGADADYGLINADVLFEMNAGGAGVVDVEGAIYKYVGDNETRKFSYFALASYLTPEIDGVGKFQPLVRIQQTAYRSLNGATPDTATAIDAQLGFVVDKFATRFALGVQHAKDSAGDSANQVFAGIQLMK